MMGFERPHALVRGAAEGRLPDWTVASGERRAHMGRVAALLGEWAEGLGLGPSDAIRWRAAGYLHDALRDEDHEVLRRVVPARFRLLPGKLLHGPAAAERLRAGGVGDEELLEAITYHTLGHPDLGALGRALYAADFLEPGRTYLEDWRAELRGRMPGELERVLREIVRARIEHRFASRSVVLPETIGFWNALASGAR